MGRRSKNDGIPEMLIEALEFVFKIIPPWTSIPLATVGSLLIVLFWDAQVKIPVLQIFGLMFGAAFAIICLIAGWKGAEFRRRQQEFLQADIDMEWVRRLSWRGVLEHQLAEVYQAERL